MLYTSRLQAVRCTYVFVFMFTWAVAYSSCCWLINRLTLWKWAPSLEGRSFISHYWGCQFSHPWLVKEQWIISSAGVLSFKAKNGDNVLRMGEAEGILWFDAYKVCNFCFMCLSCVSGSQPNAPKNDLRKLISLFSFFPKSKNDRTVSYINEECNDREPGKLKCLDL